MKRSLILGTLAAALIAPAAAVHAQTAAQTPQPYAPQAATQPTDPLAPAATPAAPMTTSPAQPVTAGQPAPATSATAANTAHTTNAEAAVPGLAVAVSELEGVDVYSANNEVVGKVDEVVADVDNREFVVITDGGFFGLGKDRLVLPLERLAMQDGRLVIRGLTEPDIDRIDGLKYDKDNYARVESPRRVNLPSSS